MALHFTRASSQNVTFSTAAGQPFQNFTYGTWATWLRRASDSGANNHGIFANDNAASTNDGFVFLFRSFGGVGSDRLGLFNVTAGSQADSTTAVTTADGWAFVALTKATGSATPVAHFLKNGAWTHENMSVAQVDNTNFSTTKPLSIGRGSTPFTDYFDGDIAALMVLDKRVLSNAEVQRLAAGNWAQWATGPTDFLVEFGPSSRFQNGSATCLRSLARNEQTSTAINGTLTRATSDPPGFRYSIQAHRL